MNKDNSKKKFVTKVDADQKKAVLVFLDYLKEPFRKFYLYIIFGLIAFFLANYYLSKQISTYTAKLSFMTAEDDSSSFSPLMQIAGQFGLSTPSGSALNSEKLVELIHSRLIILTTLMENVTINGADDLMINHFKNIYNIDEWYPDQPKLKKLRFTKKPFDEFSVNENKVSSDIYNTIVREYLNAGTSKNGIITVSYTSDSEIFAKTFLDHLVSSLSDFYVSKTNQKHRETFQIVQTYTDSLKNELIISEQALADWKDRNVLKIKTKGMLQELRLLRKVETLNTAYIEALKNLELAKFNLISSTPILQTIDKPILPLKRNKPNILFIYAIPIIVSFIFVSLLIMVLKFFRDALRS